MPGPDPHRIAQYALRRQVGSGAIGLVHEAHDVDRSVAIKLMHPAASASARRVERFLREARSAAQPIHPHVALILQVIRHEGSTFIAKEWLEGGDLRSAAWAASLETHADLHAQQDLTLLARSANQGLRPVTTACVRPSRPLSRLCRGGLDILRSWPARCRR
ncbi:protein kinase [Aquabacterium sp.]|uniref:protein kinase n=1 Tax=Aquabacterium sp. TaxID=1872578 RepID=UPI0037848BEE